MENFESWLNRHKTDFSTDELGLFSDSLKCFKLNIDRPAYLLAYQGMMLHLRNVIMRGSKPDAFAQGEWDSILKNLRNEDTWDKETSDRVKQCDKGKTVLCMPNEIRKKFEYWKDLRNICAHYKEYHFIKAHTLTLYSFIAQYLFKISIEGGKETLLQEFEEYFNPTYTSPDTPIEPLLNKITDMVEEIDLTEFITQLLRLAAKNRKNKDCYAILKQLFETESLRQAVINLLWNSDNKNSKILRARFISQYPETVLALYADKDAKYIRELWHDDLGECLNILPIYCQLLGADMIPQKEIEEAHSSVLQYLYTSKRLFDLQKDEIRILQETGYFDCFLNNYLTRDFTSKEYKTICYKTDFYIYHLQYIDYSENLVRNLVDIFENLPYPYILEDRIKQNFLDGGLSKRTEFEAMCKKLNLEMPNALK